MVKPYNKSYIEVLKTFNISLEKGLTEKECEFRKSKWGDNEIYFQKEKNILMKNILSVKSLYIFLNFMICIFMFLYKEYLMFGVSFLIFSINLYIKIFILIKDKESIEYLDAINKTNVEVLRNGREKIVTSKELVIGDIVYFKKNSLISSDMRILKSENLKVDESNITGEKFIKEKYDYKLDYSPSNIGEISNMVFKGSIVKEGNGVGVVVQTGNNSFLGNILKDLKKDNINKRDFLNKIEKNISITYLVLTLLEILLFFILNYDYNILLNGLYITYSISIIGLIVFYLDYIKKYYKKRGIDIRNISIIQNIRNINVMFLDKVGAISKEEFSIKKIFTDFKFKNRKEIEYSNDINLKRILDIITISNDGIYNKEKNLFKGSLIEIAYLKFISEKGTLLELIKNRNIELFKIEMEWDKKFLTTLNKNKKGYRANSRGDLEDILKRCNYIMIEGVEKELTNEYIDIIRKNNYNLLTEGLITEGIAYRNFDYKPSLSENIESNLTFVGIIALENELYDNAKEKIEKIKSKNIVPILFTEDHKISAIYLGIKTGIINSKDEVITGIEIENLKENDLIKILSKIKIFSKVNISLKNRILEIFESEGYNVLVTGENIGDIALLRKGKVGICKSSKFNIVGKISDGIIIENYLNKIFTIYDTSSCFDNGIKELLNLIKVQIVTIILLSGFLNMNISFIGLNILILISYCIYLLFITKREVLNFIFRRKIIFIFINVILFLGVSFI